MKFTRRAMFTFLEEFDVLLQGRVIGYFLELAIIILLCINHHSHRVVGMTTINRAGVELEKSRLGTEEKAVVVIATFGSEVGVSGRPSQKNCALALTENNAVPKRRGRNLRPEYSMVGVFLNLLN